MTHHENELEHKVIDHLQEAHAMEQNVLRMLDSMIATTTDQQIKSRLEEHKDETRRHVTLVRERLEALGEDTSKVKDVPAVLGALGKSLVDAARSDKPGRNARDGFVTEHMEIAAYELLERVAQRADDQATAEAAREIRADEERMADFIRSSWDKVVDLTLEEEVTA